MSFLTNDSWAATSAFFSLRLRCFFYQALVWRLHSAFYVWSSLRNGCVVFKSFRSFRSRISVVLPSGDARNVSGGSKKMNNDYGTISKYDDVSILGSLDTDSNDCGLDEIEQQRSLARASRPELDPLFLGLL